MPIASGVLVPATPNKKQGLADELARTQGVEISGIGPRGIALLFDCPTMKELTRLTALIAERADVVDLQMVYCNWEDQP